MGIIEDFVIYYYTAVRLYGRRNEHFGFLEVYVNFFKYIYIQYILDDRVVAKAGPRVA